MNSCNSHSNTTCGAVKHTIFVYYILHYWYNFIRIPSSDAFHTTPDLFYSKTALISITSSVLDVIFYIGLNMFTHYVESIIEGIIENNWAVTQKLQKWLERRLKTVQ